MVRPGRLDVRERVERGTVTVWVEGELDLSTIPVLEQHVDAQIGGGRTALTLDMSGVTFMDSSGLRYLIVLNERAQREGWPVSLVAPAHESARLVLEMTGADRALPFRGPARP